MWAKTCLGWRYASIARTASLSRSEPRMASHQTYQFDGRPSGRCRERRIFRVHTFRSVSPAGSSASRKTSAMAEVQDEIVAEAELCPRIGLRDDDYSDGTVWPRAAVAALVDPDRPYIDRSALEVVLGRHDRRDGPAHLAILQRSNAGPGLPGLRQVGNALGTGPLPPSCSGRGRLPPGDALVTCHGSMGGFQFSTSLMGTQPGLSSPQP